MILSKRQLDAWICFKEEEFFDYFVGVVSELEQRLVFIDKLRKGEIDDVLS